MARVSGASDMFRPSGESIEASAVELSQLLRRLQDTVLHATPEREKLLRNSEFERDRLASNLEYARNRLAKLEHDAENGKIGSKKLQAQGTFASQHEMLELLQDRLQDLRQIAEHQDDDDDSSDGEDLLRELGLDDGENESQTIEEPEPPSIPEPVPEPQPPATIAQPPIPEPTPMRNNRLPPQPTQTTLTTQTLRGRRGGDGQSASSTTGHTTARAALFASRRKPAPPETSTATAEAILDNQRAEQDALSDSILKMAGALKASSHKFSDTLEADKEVVGRAGEGIAKTEQSMDAARGRMGTLRKMTEGKGWWGRIILYAWVYGLMATLVLLVFVFPKLRF